MTDATKAGAERQAMSTQPLKDDRAEFETWLDAPDPDFPKKNLTRRQTHSVRVQEDFWIGWQAARASAPPAQAQGKPVDKDHWRCARCDGVFHVHAPAWSHDCYRSRPTAEAIPHAEPPSYSDIMKALLDHEFRKGFIEGQISMRDTPTPPETAAQAVPSDAQIDEIAASNLGDYQENTWHRVFARALLATVQPAQPKADLAACNFCLAQAAEARAELAQYKAALAVQPAAQQGEGA